jgi:hypothetical protein
MRRAVFLGAAALLGVAGSAHAQAIKIDGVTTARYIELRPITTQQTIGMIPLTQDLTVNAWGFGTGVRFFGEFRARASAGDNPEIWPQADDPFDVLAAYVEVDRSRFRARAGRQWKTSALGFYNFDGASLLVRASRSVTAELYGGWSLLAGESDNIAHSAIDAIEPYAPDLSRNLIGGEVKLRFAPRASVTALYQREITTDRSALHSERAAVDGTLRAGRLNIDGGVEGDVANEVINEARLRIGLPLSSHFTTTLEARKYRPYFELWTIWGAFNPIGFSEVLGTAQWQAGNAMLRAGGGLRRYGDDNGGVEFDRLRDDGWRVLADASWLPVPLVTLNGSYRADIGFGASRSQGDVGARINLNQSSYIGASLLAFQMINELQIRDGTVYGLGTDARFGLPRHTHVGWSFAIYRHDNAQPATETDWSQLRGAMFVEWTLGSNPDQKRIAGAK